MATVRPLPQPGPQGDIHIPVVTACSRELATETLERIRRRLPPEGTWCNWGIPSSDPSHAALRASVVSYEPKNFQTHPIGKARHAGGIPPYNLV
jgi:hypothetical protein